MFRVDPSFWFNCALLLYMLPLNCALAILAASWIHESFHIMAIKTFGGKIRQINFTALGIVIYADPLPIARSVVSSLAGPAGSLLLIFFAEYFPLLSVCGCIQGIFNLIPIYPLDGGRVLYQILSYSSFRNIDSIFRWVQITVSSILLLGLIILYRSPMIPVFVLLLLFCKRKSSCKEFNKAVQ